jgi:hypothetical protein
MLAVLPPVAPFLEAPPCMSDKTTLTLTINAALARQFEALAAEAGFTPNALFEQMIGELLFRNSPEFADPTHPRTIAYRMNEEGRLAGLRGELVSEAELMAMLDRFDRADGADESEDSPRAR